MLRKTKRGTRDNGNRNVTVRRSSLHLSTFLRLCTERKLRNDDLHYSSNSFVVELFAQRWRHRVFDNVDLILFFDNASVCLGVYFY